jgi:cytoskeletal protein CcmA (bactofilin family)
MPAESFASGRESMNETRLRRLRDRPSGTATLISEGCKVSGTITGNCDFQVSGQVDGDCDIDSVLVLAKSGLWTGTIRAGNVIVAGHVEGDIIAIGNVEIMDTARITGTVSGEAIAVAEGAVVEGVMKTTGQTEPTEFVEKRKSDT